ncbi:hypothetical protein Tco_0954014 [Tanacetum coccineum]|uniref:Uncharacterized protein n=1 Tax=Tanacetum coccineum TaxID=301880 RepID=A0ABQ5E493_9ASTR
MIMDPFTKKVLWDFWIKNNGQEGVAIEEFSDAEKANNDEQETAEIFRIETKLFDYETLLCTEFKEFNFILKFDPELFTRDIEITKTYEDYENELNDELEEPWFKDGVPYEICDHIFKPFHFNNGKAKWPTCNLNEDEFCNRGELPGMVRVGYMTYFHDYKWYNELAYGNLKEEALKQKAIYEKSWGDASQSVGAAAVASPVGMLELDTHSSSEADPSESSPPPVSVAPMVSPFLCSDDSESDTEIPERHVSPTPHEAMITRWRSRFSLAPVFAPPRIHRRALTARKSVRPLSSHRLALRYTSHHLDRFTFGSSSSHSSSDHSSSGHSISSHSLSGHASPGITVSDSSTPPRFVHPPLARTPQCSEAYLHWRSTQLSTMYPPTTSESSAGDSSFESSTGPSRKRCRSPAATVTSSIHATRALVPSRADLLPSRNRFRDSISPKDSVEEDIDTDVLEDIEADATAVEGAVNRDVVAGVDASIDMEVDVGVDVEDEVEDEVESSDIGTMKVGVDVVSRIDIPDGMLIPDAVEQHKA